MKENDMLELDINCDEVHFGASLTVRFLKAAEPEKDHPIGEWYEQGLLPLYAVEDYLHRVPANWQAGGGIFIPVHYGERVRLRMAGRWWKPNAVKVVIGQLNALTGEPWREGLNDDPQDYLVCPEQSWLDGLHLDLADQVVPVEAGTRYADRVSKGQPPAIYSPLRIEVYEPKTGQFLDQPPVQPEVLPEEDGIHDDSHTGMLAMTRPHLLNDNFGLETWDVWNVGVVPVYLVNAILFEWITGRYMPHVPGPSSGSGSERTSRSSRSCCD